MSEPLELLVGSEITRVAFDFAVTIVLVGEAGASQLVIEADFRLGEAVIEPGERRGLAPALDLLGARVRSALRATAGAVELQLDSGATITIPPDEQYEAWNLTTPDGTLVVCSPGGELTVFPPDEGAEHPR